MQLESLRLAPARQRRTSLAGWLLWLPLVALLWLGSGLALPAAWQPQPSARPRRSSQLSATSGQDIAPDVVVVVGTAPPAPTAKANSPAEAWPSSASTCHPTR
nr:hypothetical protein [Kallotenue papyrolyticum]